MQLSQCTCYKHIASFQGGTPFLVVATSGTTVLGAFDPLNAIADVCEKYGLWMHVDCCWGGGVMLSKKHKHLMAGIERSVLRRLLYFNDTHTCTCSY